MEEKNLSVKVYESIKTLLISLRFPPGSYLKERELANILGVSRTPIREALQRLDHEGWVSVGEGKKIQVRQVTMTDINEIFHIRSLIEHFSLSWLMDHGQPRVIAGMADACLSSMTSLEDRFAFTRMDLQFHSIIIKSMGYERIVRFWKTIHEEIVRLSYMAVQGPDRVERIIEEHSAIVDALWNRDKSAALSALNKHLHNTKIALLDKLGKTDNSNEATLPLGTSDFRILETALLETEIVKELIRGEVTDGWTSHHRKSGQRNRGGNLEEDESLPDEIEAIREAEEARARGERFSSFEEVVGKPIEHYRKK